VGRFWLIIGLIVLGSGFWPAMAWAHPDEPERSASEEGRGISYVPWVVGGAAIAFAGTAVAFWLVGDAAYEDLEAECGLHGCAASRIDQSGVATYDLLTNVFGALALASACTAVVLMWLGVGSGPDPDLALDVGPDRLVLRGVF
jgi:hypothetical protein